jgi:hypothetical protein
MVIETGLICLSQVDLIFIARQVAEQCEADNPNWKRKGHHSQIWRRDSVTARVSVG